MLTTILLMLLALASPFAGIILYKESRRFLPGNYIAFIAKFMAFVAALSLLGLHVICFLVVFRHLPLLGGKWMWLLIAAFETSIFYFAMYLSGSPFSERLGEAIILSVQEFRTTVRCFLKK